MRVLAIDTATDLCGVALVEGERLVGDVRLNQRNVHNERLTGLIKDLLRTVDCSLADLQGIAFTIGPGSFTGLRIGIAVAKGLAFSLDLPLAGVNSLEAMASEAAFWRGRICTLIQARSGEAYGAFYESDGEKPTLSSKYEIFELDDLREMMTDLTLLICHPNKLADQFSSNEQVVVCQGRPVLSPFTVAKLGHRKLSKGQVEDLSTVEPLYLKDFEPRRKVYEHDA